MTVYAPFGEGNMKPRAYHHVCTNCTYCVVKLYWNYWSLLFSRPFTVSNLRTEILVLKVKLNMKWVWLKRVFCVMGVHT